MPRDAKRNAWQAYVLHKYLIAERIYPIEWLERVTGIDADNWYRWCRNERNVPAYVIEDLARVTRDPAFIGEIFRSREVGMTVVRDQEAEGADAVMRGAVELGASVGAVQQGVSEATADRVLTHAEAEDLDKKIEEIERRTVALRTTVQRTRME